MQNDKKYRNRKYIMEKRYKTSNANQMFLMNQEVMILTKKVLELVLWLAAAGQS